MRKQAVKVMDGKIDLTDASLAALKITHNTVSREFFKSQLGYTDARLKELFGAEPDPTVLQSIAGVQ
jgi:uncharacterized protein (UPF0254 family)